jgi:hypothetical protein
VYGFVNNSPLSIFDVLGMFGCEPCEDQCPKDCPPGVKSKCEEDCRMAKLQMNCVPNKPRGGGGGGTAGDPNRTYHAPGAGLWGDRVDQSGGGQGCSKFVVGIIKELIDARNARELGHKMLEKRNAQKLEDFSGFKDELIDGGQNGAVGRHIYGHGGAILQYHSSPVGYIGYIGSIVNIGVDIFQNKGKETDAELADDFAAWGVAHDLLKASIRMNSGQSFVRPLYSDLSERLCK